jgi:hypothetical protein
VVAELSTGTLGGMCLFPHFLALTFV